MEIMDTDRRPARNRQSTVCTCVIFVLLHINTVVPGFRVLGFSALPGFRAPNAGDEAWSVHRTLFGLRAPLSQLLIFIGE